MTYNHRGIGPFFLSRAGYDRAMAHLSSSEDKPSDRGLRLKTTILALTRAAFLCRRLARLLRHRWALWPAAVRPGCLTLFSTPNPGEKKESLDRRQTVRFRASAASTGAPTMKRPRPAGLTEGPRDGPAFRDNIPEARTLATTHRTCFRV
jgi:hypothetical protein